MVGEAFDLFRQSVGIERLEGLDDARVQGTAPLLQEAPVSHLVGQRVLEQKLTLGKQPRLIDEFGGLQVRQPTMQRLLGHLRNGLQEG
jgi:hypothetical protein